MHILMHCRAVKVHRWEIHRYGLMPKSKAGNGGGHYVLNSFFFLSILQRPRLTPIIGHSLENMHFWKRTKMLDWSKSTLSNKTEDAILYQNKAKTIGESNGDRLISCIIKGRTRCHLYRFYLCVNLSELIISMRAAGLFVSNYCVITNTSSRLRGLNEDFNWLWKEEARFRPSCPWWQSLQPFGDWECSKWIVQQWMFVKDAVAFWPFSLSVPVCRIF